MLKWPFKSPFFQTHQLMATRGAIDDELTSSTLASLITI